MSDPVRDRPTVVRSARAARAAQALQREVKAGVLGATGIHAVLLFETRHMPSVLERLLAAIAIVTAFNVWLSRAAVRRFTVETVEGVRILANTAYTVWLGIITDWALPVWFFLPYMAIIVQGFGPHTRTRVAFHTLVASAVSLWDGADPSYAIGFSALAAICYSLMTAKTESIREMLEESDEQRFEIERAHRDLASANERIQNDMAALKKAEMELRQAQKLEAVGRLAAGIAHEINTPVQFVGDSVRFLKDGIGDLLSALESYRAVVDGAVDGRVSTAAIETARRTEEAADVAYLTENLPIAAERAEEGLGRVATIVRSMKEFAHPDQQTATLVDLNRAIEATTTIARNEYKYVADLVPELGELPLVPCFAGELNQVILNLVVNAAHAIADAGGSTQARGTIVVRTFVDGDAAVLQIADTGTGIPETARDHIFEPFFTTKEVGRGTGQGLAIARSVVEKHHGTISFVTEMGRGTTFTIRLPLAGRAADVKRAA